MVGLFGELPHLKVEKSAIHSLLHSVIQWTVAY